MKYLRFKLLFLSFIAGYLCLSQQDITRHRTIRNVGAYKTDSSVFVYTQVIDTLFFGQPYQMLGTVLQELDFYGNVKSVKETFPFTEDNEAIARDSMLIGYGNYLNFGDTIVEFGFNQSSGRYFTKDPIPIYMLKYNQRGDTIFRKEVKPSQAIKDKALGNPIQLDNILKLDDTRILVTGYIGNNPDNLTVMYFAIVDTLGNVLQDKLITRQEYPGIFLNLSLFYSDVSNKIHVYYNDRQKFILDANTLEIEANVSDNFAGFLYNYQQIQHPKYKYIQASSWDGENPATSEQIYETENSSDVFLFLFDDSLNVDTVQIKLPNAEVMFLSTENVDYVDSNNIYLGVSHHFGFHSEFAGPYFDNLALSFSLVKCNIKGDVIWNKKIFDFLNTAPDGKEEVVNNAAWKVFGLEDGGMIAIVTRFYHERRPQQMDVLFIRTDNEGTVVSVKTINPTKKIAVYPNPASRYIKVEIPNNKNYTYAISNLSGQVVSTGNYQSNEEINLDNLPTGTYIISLLQAENGDAFYSTFQKK